MADMDHFTKAGLGFLTDLKANNTRDWFADHKALYEAEIKTPAEALSQTLAAELEALTGARHEAKIFRIYRDVRFSKDKTPYNAHVHMSFTPDLPQNRRPMWFFGLGTEKLTLGCGIFGFEKDALHEFRAEMAGPRGGELIDLTRKLQAGGFRIGDPALKTVPRGYDKDHPHSEVLRRKGFSVWDDLQDLGFVTRPDLGKRSAERLKSLLPVYHFFAQ